MKPDVDLTAWALPLRVDWSRNRIIIHILCFEWWISLKTENEYEPDQTPEEELAEIEEYLKEHTKFVAEWRAEVQGRMGVVTK